MENDIPLSVKWAMVDPQMSAVIIGMWSGLFDAIGGLGVDAIVITSID